MRRAVCSDLNAVVLNWKSPAILYSINDDPKQVMATTGSRLARFGLRQLRFTVVQ
jgi:hypothetical protein